MESIRILLVGIILVVGAVSMSHSAVGTADPIADAGVDQEVERNATVLLDASGSHAPDGDVVDYEWTVTGPLGDSVDVECEETCRLAEFQALHVGTYEVTVEVEDDEGRTDTDTIYVESETDVDFDVSLYRSWDSESTEALTLNASISAGDHNLKYIQWSIDGNVVENYSSNGINIERQKILDVDEFPVTVNVTVGSHSGQTVNDSFRIDDTAHSVSNDETDARAVALYPSITGDQIVTGEMPLGTRYSISETRYDADFVWQNGQNETFGRGQEVTIQWVPGEHELYAHIPHYVRTDNGELRPIPLNMSPAGFHSYFASEPDHQVIADPQPQIEEFSVDADVESVTVDVHVEELYSTLTDVRISIDGETVEDLGTDDLGETFERSLTHSVSDGETNVTVVAEDQRGQTVERTETADVPESETTGSDDASDDSPGSQEPNTGSSDSGTDTGENTPDDLDDSSDASESTEIDELDIPTDLVDTPSTEQIPTDEGEDGEPEEDQGEEDDGDASDEPGSTIDDSETPWDDGEEPWNAPSGRR